MSMDDELDKITEELNMEKVKNEDTLALLGSGESFWDILSLAKEHLSEEHYNELYFDLYMLDETGYNDRKCDISIDMEEPCPLECSLMKNMIEER